MKEKKNKKRLPWWAVTLIVLLSAIVIPNIAGVLSKTQSPITMGSPQDVLMVILAFAILLVGGMLLNKRGRSILR